MIHCDIYQMSAYFFYPAGPITTPSIANIYSREKEMYEYEKITVNVISEKQGGEWEMPYFESGKLCQSVGGVAQFVSMRAVQDVKYAEKFINFVCYGEVTVQALKGNQDFFKVSRQGNKEFIVYYEENGSIGEINEELLYSIRGRLPPISCTAGVV